MHHLDMTLWPIDHMDMPFSVPRPRLVRYQKADSGTIAQIEIKVDSRVPKNAAEEIFRTLNKWPSPELTSLSEIPFNEPESNLLDPQFVLHVLPLLEIETPKDVADFIEQHGTLNLKEYKNMDEYVHSIAQSIRHEEKIHTQDIKIGQRKYGTVTSMQTRTAIAMIRDLKAMAKHIIAYSNNEPEWPAWEEAGYIFKDQQFAQLEARTMLKTRLTQGLGMMSLTPIFDFANNKDEFQNTKAKTGLYQAACLQIFKFYNMRKPISKCSHEYCNIVFATATGYGGSRKQKDLGLKYCSLRCSRNASQLAHRRRKANEKVGNK